jgi:hypothetical protein
MKKSLIILAAIGFMAFGYSCKKCGTCSSGGTICTDQPGVTQASLDSYKASCEGSGYTYTEE